MTFESGFDQFHFTKPSSWFHRGEAEIFPPPKKRKGNKRVTNAAILMYDPVTILFNNSVKFNL